MDSLSLEEFSMSIGLWMSFNSRIGRSFLLQEASIRYPATDYLLGVNDIELADIELEKTHRIYLGKSMDLAINKPTMIRTKGKVVGPFNVFMEFKIASGKTGGKKERGRIFADLVRLAVLQDPDEKCYFLMCGSADDFSQEFELKHIKNNKKATVTKIGQTRTAIKSTGFFNEWFKFSLSSPVQDFDTTAPPTSDHDEAYQTFINDYKVRSTGKRDPSTGKMKYQNAIPPKLIRTRLVYKSQKVIPANLSTSPYSVAIWEVDEV